MSHVVTLLIAKPTKETRGTCESVTIDMAGGFIKSVSERAPQAQIVFDRFHVQRLASNAVAEVRQISDQVRCRHVISRG